MTLQDDDLLYGQMVVPTVDLPEEAETSNVDDANYDTLKDLQNEMHDFKRQLFGDFNTFNIDPDKATATQLKQLKTDIEVRQGVWALVEPLIEKVDNAISAVDIKRKN